MATVLRTLKPASGRTAAARDPAQLQQGALYLSYERHQPPGSWSDNRLAQARHYTGTIFLALSAVQQAMSGAAAWLERLRRRDRTTFGPNNSTAVVKALGPSGGAGNDEDYAPVHDHPLADVLAHPNPNETFGALLGYQTLQWGLTGNGPVWFVPGKGHGRPVEVYALVEALLQPAHGPSEYYPEGAWRVTPYYPSGLGWAYGALANRMLSTAILPGTEVRKARAPHPLVRNDGYSPLSACGVQFDIMEAIDVSRHSAFMQGTQLGTVVYVPGVNEDGVERVKAGFREKYGGPHNARAVAVVSSPPGAAGEFKIEQMGESPREMDYAQSWEQATRFVLATFGVHAAIAGLKDTSGYAELYAAREQFHGRMSDVAKCFADFYTHHLAGPWSKRPGEYRIKIQLPKPRNEDARNQQTVSLGQMGALPLNAMLRALDFAPVKGGDLPLPLYLKKLESEVMPQPEQPAPDAAGPNAEAPDGGAQQPGAEDTPEAAQDSTVSAALAGLGVPDESDQNEEPEVAERPVEKGIRVTKPGGTRTQRQEGEVWSTGGDNYYTKKNGKIVRTAPPGDRANHSRQVAPPASGAGATGGAHPGGLVDVRKVIADHGDDTVKAGAAIRARVAAHLAAGGTASIWMDGKRHAIKRADANNLLDDKGQHWGVQALASGAPGTKTGVEFHPVAGGAAQTSPPGTPPPLPTHYHDELAKRLIAKQPAGMTPGLMTPTGEMVRITDGASVRTFLAKGGKLPDSHFAEAAKAVPVTGPVAAKTISTVETWAAGHADKHADRVAAHFGIDRARAHALLLHAITQVAKHAKASGGNVGALSIRDKRTGKTATLAPKSGTGPARPNNPAGKGTLPPRPTVGKALPADRATDEVRPELVELLDALARGPA